MRGRKGADRWLMPARLRWQSFKNARITPNIAVDGNHEAGRGLGKSVYLDGFSSG
jgi:uncharacterized protein (DUF2237 family)